MLTVLRRLSGSLEVFNLLLLPLLRLLPFDRLLIMSVLATIARSAARAARPAARVPTASLSLAARSVHTLPKLDYAYDVRPPLPFSPSV